MKCGKLQNIKIDDNTLLDFKQFSKRAVAFYETSDAHEGATNIDFFKVLDHFAQLLTYSVSIDFPMSKFIDDMAAKIGFKPSQPVFQNVIPQAQVNALPASPVAKMIMQEANPQSPIPTANNVIEIIPGVNDGPAFAGTTEVTVHPLTTVPPTPEKSLVFGGADTPPAVEPVKSLKNMQGTMVTTESIEGNGDPKLRKMGPGFKVQILSETEDKVRVRSIETQYPRWEFTCLKEDVQLLPPQVASK